MTRRWILPILLVLFVSAACGPAPELRNEAYLQDRSLVEDENCTAPCWEGLVPGESSWLDAREVIETGGYTDVERSESEEDDAEAISFGQTEGQPCCYIYTATGETVDRIWLLMAPDIRLREVIEIYDEPAYIQAEDFPGEQALVALLYPDQPMVVYVYAESIETGIIGENSEVIGVLHLSETEMDNVLTYENFYEWDEDISSADVQLAEIIDGNFDVTAEASPPEE